MSGFGLDVSGFGLDKIILRVVWQMKLRYKTRVAALGTLSENVARSSTTHASCKRVWVLG